MIRARTTSRPDRTHLLSVPQEEGGPDRPDNAARGPDTSHLPVLFQSKKSDLHVVADAILVGRLSVNAHLSPEGGQGVGQHLLLDERESDIHSYRTRRSYGDLFNDTGLPLLDERIVP
jgi:hypothetical protein